MARNNESSTTASVDLTKALAHGGSGIKKKIRDITRLLSRDNLAADVKIANERALKTLKIELGKVNNDNQTKKIAQKYHKVRFFEKKKAIRFYKQSLKNVEELKQHMEKLQDAELVKEDKKKLKKLSRVFEHCQVDLAYVLNFPKNEKYISLYAKSDINNEQLSKKAKDGIKRANEKKDKFKKIFSEQLKNNQLEIPLDEGIKGGDFRSKTNNNVVNSNNNNNNSNSTKETVDAVEEKNSNDKEAAEEDDFFE